MLLASNQQRVRYVPLEVVDALEKECKEAGGLQPEIQGGLAFIYPGTKWCGPGELHKNFISNFAKWNTLMIIQSVYCFIDCKILASLFSSNSHILVE